MTFLLPDALRDAWTMPADGRMANSTARRDGEPWRDFARRLRELLAAVPDSRAATVQAALVAGRYVICAEATADGVLATIAPRLRH